MLPDGGDQTSLSPHPHPKLLNYRMRQMVQQGQRKTVTIPGRKKNSQIFTRAVVPKELAPQFFFFPAKPSLKGGKKDFYHFYFHWTLQAKMQRLMCWEISPSVNFCQSSQYLFIYSNPGERAVFSQWRLSCWSCQLSGRKNVSSTL